MRFLVEFLGQGRWRPLSALTREPLTRPLAAPPSSAGPVAIDLYVRPALRRAPGLVLVHGLSPEGKDDARLREAAGQLARAGWAVAVPTVRGLTALRLRPDDAGVVAASVQALRAAGYPRVAILGVSLGAGPALLAAAEPGLAGDVSAVLALGGYASAVELLRYTLTGAYAFAELSGRASVHEEAIAEFARANTELVDGAGRRLVDNPGSGGLRRAGRRPAAAHSRAALCALARPGPRRPPRAALPGARPPGPGGPLHRKPPPPDRRAGGRPAGAPRSWARSDTWRPARTRATSRIWPACGRPCTPSGGPQGADPGAPDGGGLLGRA